MKYQLLENNRGILIDRTAIITDVKGSPALSFLLPGEGDYYAILTAGTGIALKCKIHANGDCPLRSRDLIGKRQYYDLTVTQLNGNGDIIRTWECEPLLVSSLNYALKSQWQISGGVDEKDCIARLSELEKAYNRTVKEFSTFKAEMTQLFNELATHVEQYSAETTQSVQTLTQELATAETAITGLKSNSAALADIYSKARALIGG